MDRDQLDGFDEFVRRGQSAQRAVNEVIREQAREPYRPRGSDPETSAEWAARMNVNYGDQWARIEAAIAAAPRGPDGLLGLTYREVTDATGIDGTVTSTSMKKMETAGILRRLKEWPTGKLVKRDGCMVRVVIPVADRRR